ncbi:MAG: WD40/YVTN/BNR-like repeat-containing protein [Candidatus Binataceae bacterium]
MLGLTVETSGTTALVTSNANEMQQLLSTPSALPRGTQISRRTGQAANKSKEISTSAPANHRPIAAVVAPVHNLETGLSSPSAKAQLTPPERVSSISPAGNVEHLASAGTSPPANVASGANASQDPARTGGSAIIGRPVSESRIPIAAVVLPAARAKAESAKASAVSAAMSRSILVSSPDHSVYWALEDSGTIFRSTDRTSWQKQHSGVKSDLLAGQAPSNSVCWVVGRDGTILLTIDGTRWQRIKPPITTDLVGVSASGADVADIVAADGLRFSTFDRGSNWQPIN